MTPTIGNVEQGTRNRGAGRPASRRARSARLPCALRKGRGAGLPRLAFVVLALLLGASSGSGQVATGLPPFGSFGGGSFDTVDVANLNVHFSIPVVEKAGRGLPFNYDLSYDSSIWVPTTSSGYHAWTPVGQTTSMPSHWGWQGLEDYYTGFYTYTHTGPYCTVGGTNYYWDVYSNFIYRDPAGTVHSFNIVTRDGNAQCNISPITSATAVATDGSGLTMSVTNYTNAVVFTRSGGIIAPSNGSGYAGYTDSNGNQVTAATGSTVWFTDTLNTTAINISGLGTELKPYMYTYTAASGNQTSVAVEYQDYQVGT